jgi:hypothetical protein
MGAVLSGVLAAHLTAAGMNPAAISLDRLLDPVARRTASAAVEGVLRDALAAGIYWVYIISFAAAALGLLVVVMTPRGRLADLAAARDRRSAAEIGAMSSGPARALAVGAGVPAAGAAAGAPAETAAEESARVARDMSPAAPGITRSP